MAGNYRVMIVVLVAVFLLNGACGTVTGNEPFISLACDNGLYVSPIDELSFDEITEFEYDAIDSAYDPVNEKIHYITDVTSGNVNIDGTNKTVLQAKNPKGISYDYETGANLAISFVSRLNVESGIVYQRNIDADSTIAALKPAEFIVCSHSYTYVDPDDQDFKVQAADVDMCGRTISWLQRTDNKSKILSRHLDDFDGSTIQTLYYGDNDSYDVNDMQIYKGSVYFVHSSDGPGGPILSKLPLTGGEPEALECLTNVSTCNGVYIYDPAPSPQPCEPIPYLLKADIPVIMGRLWRGGFIAHMEIHITSPLSAWRIEIYFPNRVYELEIEGCDAKVLEKHDVNRANFEKGTMWVLIPGPKSTSLDIGDKIRVKFIGKTNPTRRGFIRDVLAKFYRLPVVPPCD